MASRKRHDIRLRVSDEVKDLIGGMHPQLKKKTKSALKLILSDPSAGKALKEDLKGLYSYRIGHFRIIYRIAPNRIIEIIAIGPRRRIYEETYILVKRESEKK